MNRTIVTSDDVLDSRDIQERIDELADMLADVEDEDRADYADEIDELRIWDELKKATDGAGWEYGIVLIRDSYFRQYSQDLAEDIGAIDRNANWPLTHIDWAGAADDLRVDYTGVEIDGADYWYRDA